jgi:hypothetical protein
LLVFACSQVAETAQVGVTQVLAIVLSYKFVTAYTSRLR